MEPLPPAPPAPHSAADQAPRTRDPVEGRPLPGRIREDLDRALERPLEELARQAQQQREARTKLARESARRYLAELEKHPPEPKAARLHYECARVLEHPLGDRVGAREHYQKACVLAPDHVPSLEGARRTLDQDSQRDEALRLTDVELACATDPKHQVRLLYERGRLLEGLKRAKEAREAFASALTLAPTDVFIQKSAIRSARQAKDADRLETLYRDVAATREGDSELRAALLAECARFAERERRDVAEATELYHRAFIAHPTSLPTLHALKRLLYREKRWGDLTRVLAQEAEHSVDARVRALAFYRMGRLHHDVSGDIEAAVKAFEAAAREAPEERIILTELARLYEASERFRDLLDVLTRLAALETAKSSQVLLFHELGLIADERLGDREKAMEWQEKALSVDPTFVPALQALANLCVKHGSFRRLVEMHLTEAAHLVHPERRAMAHARAAELLELELKDTPAAIVHYARALAVFPGHVMSLKALCRLYAQEGKTRELIELLERAVDWTQDLEGKTAYLFRIGRAYEDLLHNCGSAVHAYRRVLELSPGHLGALHAWQRAAERGGLWTELVLALEAEVECTPEVSGKLPLLHRLGEVLEERQDDANLALLAYQAAVSLDEGYTPVLSNLGRLYFRLGRFKELIRTHELELRHITRPDARAALYCKMGDLYQARLGDEVSAVLCFQEALRADPELEKARAALEVAYRRRAEWTDLADLFEKRLATLKDKPRRSELLFRLGELCESRLSKPDRALEAYEQASQEDPSFRPAQDGRIRLLTERGEWKRLVLELGREASESSDVALAVAARLREAEVLRDDLGDLPRATVCLGQVLLVDPSCVPALLALESIHEETGNLKELGKVLDHEARVFTDLESRISALRQRARLVGIEPEVAQGCYLAILQLAPDDFDALKSLENLGLKAQDIELLAGLDAAACAAPRHPSLKAAHATRLAEALEVVSASEARHFYRMALAVDGKNWAAALGLARLAEQSGDAVSLVEAAESVLRIAEDRERAALLMVQAFDAQSVESPGAVELLERALEVAPDCTVATRRLEEALLRTNEPERLFDVLTRTAQSAKDSGAAALNWGIVARVQADQRGDLAAGVAALLRAHERAPSDMPTLLGLAELYYRSTQWLEAADAWSRVLAMSDDQDVLLETHVRLATLLAEQLREPKRAFKHLEAALRLRPGHLPTLVCLLGLQRTEGSVAGAEATAEEIVRASREPEEQARALVALGEVRRVQGKAGLAFEAFEKAVLLAGARSGATTELFSLIEKQQPLEKQASYQRFALALGSHTRGARGDSTHFLELARVLGDGLGQHDEAFRVLEAGMAACPEDLTLGAALAVRLRLSGRLGEAAQTLRRLIEVDVRRAATWRDLAETYFGLERPIEQAQALSALVALQAATELERATLAAHGARPHLRKAGLDALAMQSLGVTLQESPAASLLVTLSDSLGRLHPPDFGRYRLAPEGRFGSRSPHPLRALADYVASVLGLAEFDLYVHRQREHRIWTEFTDPIAFLVPECVLALDEIQQILVLSRAMINAARRLHAVDRFSASELELLLAAAAHDFEPSFRTRLVEPAELGRYARRVHKALPWLGRGGVEEAAVRYAAKPPAQFSDFVREAQLEALKLALLVADALPAAVRLLEDDPELLGFTAEAATHGVLDELLGFWMSDAAQRVRHRIGALS